MNRSPKHRSRSQSLFRSALLHETLEQRNLFAVTAQLIGGVLDISMDADRDSAEVNVDRGVVTVRASSTNSFELTKINSINVSSSSGSEQSLTFHDALAVTGSLAVTDIDHVSFAAGDYQFGSVTVVSGNSIDFSSFQLRATGNIVLTAQSTVSSTESGLLGFLGAVGLASSSIRLVDSGLFGGQIDVTAQTTLDANASGDENEDTNRDLARVKTVGSSEIIVAGNSSLNATGNISLQATTVQTVTANAFAKPTSTNSARDAAVALTNVTSNATISLDDRLTIVAAGELSLLANNTVTVTTNADGSLTGASGKGGIVALSELTGNTSVNIGGATNLSAAAITTKATSKSTLNTTSKSSVGGATANDASTQSDLQNNDAQSSAGGLGLAAAYARTKTNQTTEVIVSGTVSLVATRDVNLGSDASTSATTTANAGATNNAGDASSGVGVAIALDRSTGVNRVTISGLPTVRAANMLVTAGTTSGDLHNTTATSGVGAANVGGAGALASNKLLTTTDASIASEARLASGATTVKLTADSQPNLTADAKPTVTSDRIAKKGIGASIARNKLTNNTTASLADKAAITGSGDLSILAASTENTTTTATTGAEGGSSLTAGVGTTVIDSNTLATLGSGDALTISGAMNIQAARAANITTTVDGTSVGQTAARGGSFALNDIDALVNSSVDRAVSTSGNIDVKSSAAGAVTANAKASVKGTGSTTTSDQQTAAEQQAGGSDKPAPSAEALGKVSAGAAAAINLIDVKSNTQIKSRALLNSNGAVSMAAANTTDSEAKADASAVASGTTTDGTTTGGTERGRAVAVAINRATIASQTNTEPLAVINASTGVSLDANTTVGTDVQRTFAAEAVSGAGSRKTGFAGGFALNRVDNSSSVQVIGTAINVGTGALNVRATNTASNSAKATPSIPTTGSDRGIGASFALNIANNDTLADVNAGSTITSASAVIVPSSSNITATSNQTAVTESKGGSGAEDSDSKRTTTAVYGIQAVKNTTEAHNLATTTNLSGSLAISADLTSNESLLAEGQATGTEKSRGLVLAFDMGNNQTHANASGQVTSTGAVSIKSNANITSSVNSKAASKGGDVTPTVGGADKNVTDAKKLATDQGASDNGEEASKLETPEGSATFAAALAIGISKTSTTADVNDAARIISNDAITVQATGKTTSTVKADASAVTVDAAAEESTTGTDESETPDPNDARGRGVGVAIALHVNKVETRATVGTTATVRGSSLTVSAGSPAQLKSDFVTEAISGAGGGKVGTAGSLAIDVVHNSVDARIKAASVDVDAGTLKVEAINLSDSSNTAQPSTNASGSKRGRGASIAINVTRNSTQAEIEDNAIVRDATTPTQAGAGNVVVKADSLHSTSTVAKGGAGQNDDTGNAAATFVNALARVVNDTEARLSGSAVGRSHASGNVEVTANHQGSTTTSAIGDSRAAKTAVGLVFDLGFVRDNVNAEIAGNWDVDGNVITSANNSASATGNATASARGGEADKKLGADGKGDVSVKTSSSKNLLEKTDGNQAIDEETPDSTTPDGSMSLAAALAFNVGRANATARLADAADIRAVGIVSILSKSKANITAVSDASAVAIPAGENNQVQNGTSSGGNQTPTRPDPSQTGVGVAISINAARIKTEATVGGNAKVRATALIVDAGTDVTGQNDHNFSTQAISGTGVDKIGFAGSLGIQSVENDSLAAIRNGANVQLVASSNPALAAVNQNLTVTSRNETSSLAKADASVAGGPTTGIGPSIIINASQNSSHAEVTGANFTGQVHDFLVDASGNYTAFTRAETGVTSKPTLQGEGGLAISPALAVGVHRTSTLATAGADTQSIDVDVTGKLQVHANHDSTSISSADSIVNASGNSAIGTPVAVNIARDDAKAATIGTFDVTGDASIVAHSNIDAISGATATQNGARAGSGEAKRIQDRAQSWAQGFRREPGEPREKILDRLEDRLTEVGDKLEELSEAAMETTGVAAAGAANVVLSNTLAEVSGTLLASGSVELIAQSDRDVNALATGLAVAPTNEDSYGGAIAVNIAEQTIEARAHGNNALAGQRITVRAGAEQNNTHALKARALAGGGAKDDGVAGSIALNFADDKIEASVGKSPILDAELTMNVTAVSGISITADSHLEVQNVAGAGSIGLQADGKGGALAVNFLRTETSAVTGTTTTLTTGGALNIAAAGLISPTHGDIAGNPIALAAGGSGGGDQARAGAAAINILNETTLAQLGEDNVVQTSTITGPRGQLIPGNVAVQATSETELNTGAGALSLGLKLGRSVGVALNFINRDVDAKVGDGSTISSAGSVSVEANATQDYFSIAAAPALGGSVNKPNFGGAIQVLSQIHEVGAEIGQQSTINATGDVLVKSANVVTVDAIAGSVAGAQNQSIAGSLNIVSLLDRSEASVGQSATINTAGNAGLTVQATGQEHLLPIAVGGSGAGSSAAAGSINFIHVDEATLAHIDDSATVNARNLLSPGATQPGIKVLAQNDLTQNSTSGVVAGAGKKGLGGSLDAVLIDKDTRAYVGSGTHLDADQNILITANSSEDLLSVGASVGASGNTSVMGALAGYSVDILTQAVLGDTPTDTVEPGVAATAHARGSVLVHANDDNEMDFVSGGVGISGGTAAGGAATIASVRKQTDAHIAKLAEVNADALGTIAAVPAKNGQFSISFADAAFDTNRVVPPTLGSKDVDGDGINDLTDSSIAHPRLATANVENRKGVMVTATNTDDIAEIVAGAGIGGGFTVGVSTPATILRVDTTAEIGSSAKINTTNQNIAGSTQSVLVAAGNDLSHLTLSGALALSGSGAIAPAGNVESTKINTRTAIGDSATIAARQDVDVRATATEDTLMISAAGGGGGSFGGSGSVAVYKLDNQTYASIGAGADVDAGGNVVVVASDTTDLDNIAGAAGLGFGGGVGVSIGINAIHKDTQAFIANDASVDAKANSSTVPILAEVGSNGFSTTTSRGVVVEAVSSETLLNIAAAGAAGFGAGAGSLSVNVIDSDTSAFIGDRAHINSANTGANAAQSVHVLAGNIIKGRSISGGLAVGAGSFAGAGDIGVVRNDTTTFVGHDAQVKANNDIVVHSLAKEEIDSLGVSGGFAATGSFAAAAAVWVLGTKFDANYSNDVTTTNALQNGNSTVDQQAANGAGTTRNVLTNSLNNYNGVTNTQVANPTPTQQIADLLRVNRQSISSELLTGAQLSADLFDASDATGTVAEVRSGSVLDAGDDVSVRADSIIDLSTISGSVAGAAGFALGAAVTVDRTHMNTDVLMAGRVDHADEVLVQAASRNDTIGRGFSANGAIGGALGAVVNAVRDTSATTARVDGNPTHHAAVEQATSFKVAAKSNTNLEAVTGQGSVAGVAAVGVTITRALAEGITQATIGDNADVGQSAGESVGNLSVNATTNTHTQARGIAVQAGVGGAGALNFATAQTVPTVLASVGTQSSDANSKVKVNGTVDVDAVSNSSSAADMLGLQLALGASLGFSRARAIVAPVVTAAVGRATTIEAGGNVTIDAIHDRPQVITLPNGSTIVTERGAVARAEAGGGAAIAGNTAQAQAESSPNVSAHILPNASVITPSLLHVLSESNNNPQAVGGTITIGVASAGGVQTTSTIQGTSQASIGQGVSANIGNLEVLSTVLDRGVSNASAATGGIISGNAVTSTASLLPVQVANRFGLLENIPSSSVEVSGATIQASGNVTLKANEQADVDALAKGVAIGGVFTAGKSDANVTVKPLLSALVTGSSITAIGNIVIESRVGDITNPSVKAMNIEESDAVSEDGISLAFAKGSGGALIGLIGSSADTIVKPVVNTNVRQSTLTANDISIQSEDDASAAAIARNFSLGLIARGQANANLDMKDDLSVSVSGAAESGQTLINAARNFTLKTESDQDGDAFSNTRAIAGLPTGRATTNIKGDYDLSATVGENVVVNAGNLVQIIARAEKAEFGSQQSNDPTNPTNVFGRPNYIGANANSDTAGLSSDAFATSTTTLGTSTTPSVTVASVGRFSKIVAPTITISADVQGINLKSDASARSAGATVDVSSISTAEVHSVARLDLSSDSIIDATTVNLSSLNGSNSIKAEVESTTDKDGLDLNPEATGTIRMDTESTIDARDRALIHTRNLNVLADANVTQFDLFVKENDTERAGTGTRVSSFERDRSIHWNADLVLKGATSPTLIVDQDSAGNAVVTSASGVSIQDTDGFTLGPVAAANIVVNAINNSAAFGNVSLNVPRRGAASADTGIIDGQLGSVTVERGFDEVNLINRSSKAMTVNNVSVFNMSTPLVVVDAPNSSVLSFPVFQNFGDTQVNIENSIKSTTVPALTVNGIINNPVGETKLKAGSILKSGSGKVVTNVADIRATTGNIGSSTRLPIEIVVSDGRQENLTVNSAGSVALDLLARQRQANGSPAPVIDVTAINATTTSNLLLHTTVLENNLPPVPPLLRVNEIQENDVTDVVSFFETQEEIISLDLGALGTGTTTGVISTWNFGLLAGSTIGLALDAAQIDGPLMNLVGNTDVGTGNMNVSTNGNIQLTEAAGPMRIGAITTTRGNVTLNSTNAIAVSPIDTTADIVGNSVSLNAATTIGSTSAPVDVDSGNRLNASAAGEVVLVETNGNANVGLVASTAGNVSLTVSAGSIFDADADPAADIVGNNVTLTTNNATLTAATIGTAANAVEIDSSVAAAGVVRAIAGGDVNLVESAGGMTLAEVRSANGNIRIDVPDTAGTGSDLTLSSAQVVATLGSVQLNAGDNLSATGSTLVQGTLIGMVADVGNADPGLGSTVNLAGTFIGRPITLATGDDVDIVTLNQTAFQGQVNLSLAAGSDLLTINRLAPLTTSLSGIRDTLAVNLGAGANQVTVNSSPTGNFIAPITATRGTGANVLTINDTTGNDVVALNATQAAITRPGSGVTELLAFGSNLDRVIVNATDGNDALAIDLAGGNLNFTNGVSFSGGAGTDQVSLGGSTQADSFEVDATSATSGIIRTQVGSGAFAAPLTVTTTEQVGFNGLNPTTSPGDRLIILDSVAGVPTVPSGSISTPLPVVYTNIEQVIVGAVPAAVNDQFTILEDAISQFNLFANDTGLTDLPLSVSIVQPTLGTVAYSDGGTALLVSDDRFVFTPRANTSGITSFQYTVIDNNGDRSTATVQVTIDPVADAPSVAAQSVSGNEGQPILLNLKAALVDNDGSETLQVLVRQVPSMVSFVDGKGSPVGLNLGSGDWDLSAVNLGDLYLLANDNAAFSMLLVATASESGRLSATSSAAFDVSVANVAPQATIMSVPTDTPKDSAVTVQMAATDPSVIDKNSGFVYKINWGDGSALQIVPGQPGQPPAVDHVYAANGIYTITISATDKDGATGSTTSQVIRIGQSGIVADPLNPGKTMLVLQGSEAHDVIRVTRQGNGSTGRLLVYRSEVLSGTYAIPTSRILVNALGGDDTVFVDPNVSTDAWLVGGRGNDSLTGGAGNNVLVGGDGNDDLRTRQGRDILFGGHGSDYLFGGSDEDILLAGASVYDLSDAALAAIQREWLAPKALSLRIAHLHGDQPGGLNDGRVLIGSGANQTAFDDDAMDILDNHHTKDWVLANNDQAIHDLFKATNYLEELDARSQVASAASGEGGITESAVSAMELDVDGNGIVTPMDALRIINQLNRGEVADTASDTDDLLDVSHDHHITAMDALLVINRLNSPAGLNIQAEGEAQTERRSPTTDLSIDPWTVQNLKKRKISM